MSEKEEERDDVDSRYPSGDSNERLGDEEREPCGVSSYLSGMMNESVSSYCINYEKRDAVLSVKEGRLRQTPEAVC